MQKGKTELLGKTCQDIVTGFEGICTSIVEYVYGCCQYGVRAKDKDYASHFFYEAQLKVVDDGISDTVEVPQYSEPDYFGMKVCDKVTKEEGYVTGRVIHLFSGIQYVLECGFTETTKEPQVMFLDEGRISILDDGFEPREVQAKKPGGLLDASEYPAINTMSI